ncbi:MAG: hypothetical protein IJB30_00245 [Clostridia bacterium]|nr:hypothetical protein [Clostridia bacterium]MBQ6703570.1 hypothetical protein [Clostridia bacterium]
MKRTLRTGKPMPNTEEVKKAAEQMDPNLLGNVQSAINKYANRSEAELMQELAAAKQSGLIDPAALASVAGRIAPMLSPQQHQRLEEVLKQLQ